MSNLIRNTAWIVVILATLPVPKIRAEEIKELQIFILEVKSNMEGHGSMAMSDTMLHLLEPGKYPAPKNPPPETTTNAGTGAD